MTRHKYINVKYSDYTSYVDMYGTDKIDKWHRVYPHNSKSSSIVNISGLLQEYVFEPVPTDYDTTRSGDNFLFTFYSKRGNGYRLDLIREPDTTIYHVAFSDASNHIGSIDYEIPTNKGEAFDVISRISWILGDICDVVDASEYCVGGTGDTRKDAMYKYMMKYAKTFDVRKTDHYESGWALYFTM
jgi:hypothetical protein